MDYILDYDALAQAWAALSPVPATDLEAADLLNAQTRTLPPQDIPVGVVKNTYLLSGEWFPITQLAKRETSGTNPPTDADMAIIAAFLTVETLNSGRTTAIATSRDDVWVRVNQLIGALVAAGVVSTETYNALAALRTPAVPLWPVILTEHDVAAAREKLNGGD